MSMVAMREVRKGGSVPNTSRQFALKKRIEKEYTRGHLCSKHEAAVALKKRESKRIKQEVIFVPNTRQFALIKEKSKKIR
jgi:hypothetical protein